MSRIDEPERAVGAGRSTIEEADDRADDAFRELGDQPYEPGAHGLGCAWRGARTWDQVERARCVDGRHKASLARLRNRAAMRRVYEAAVSRALQLRWCFVSIAAAWNSAAPGRR